MTCANHSGGRSRASVTGTRATTGAGSRWTRTFVRSRTTCGRSTGRPWARATATAAATARSRGTSIRGT
jgi:hypothetical protein